MAAMCARYSLARTDAALADLFGVPELASVPPREMIYPTQDVPVVVEGPRGVRRLGSRRWGLVPHWADDPTIGQKMLNARSETVAEKPSFRRAFAARRCLVPADGFFEWLKDGKARIPHRFARADGRAFAFAGIWERWGGRGGNEAPPHGSGAGDDAALETVAILTTLPNETVAPVHDRMPVILPETAWGPWLDPENRDTAALAALLVPFAAAPLSCMRLR
ncbi:MAG: putative SOS response-associated peptidase YedK [Planctomycetes bacterium]|nr:putative SOS response-associated peptidase YedK [Planctomycetota bacterium]